MDNLLILWDVDHTLLNTGGVGREIFGEAFRAATGHTLTEMPAPAGQTEPELFREALHLHSIPDDPAYFSTFAEHQARGYTLRSSEVRTRGEVLPGIEHALSLISEFPSVKQSILSGNTRSAAKAKLDTFDLSRFLDLDIGAYGDDSPSRPNLVGIAQKRASSKYGIAYDAETTFIVGDTPRDIQAGKTGGARVIAVATGRTPVDELRRNSPEAAFGDLSDSESFLRCLRLVS